MSIQRQSFTIHRIFKNQKGKSLRENSGILPVIGRASADTLVIGQIGLITMETHRFSRHLVDFGRILAYLTETKRFFRKLKKMFLKIITFIAVIVQGLNLNGPKLVKWNSDADASQVNPRPRDPRTDKDPPRTRFFKKFTGPRPVPFSVRQLFGPWIPAPS